MPRHTYLSQRHFTFYFWLCHAGRYSDIYIGIYRRGISEALSILATDNLYPDSGNYITARGDAEMSGGFWMCNMCVTYGVYVVRVCVGTSSLDEAECNSSKPRDVYHLNAVNLRPSANPLASRAKRSFTKSVCEQPLEPTSQDLPIRLAGPNHTCNVCTCASSRHRRKICRPVKKWWERNVSLAEKKTSHCGRSLSSSEKTRYDVEERINRGSESNYREILQNTVTEMWYPVRLSGAM